MRNLYPKKTAEKEDGASKVIFDFSGEVEQKERKKKKCKSEYCQGCLPRDVNFDVSLSEFQKAGISTIRSLIKHIIIYSFFYIHEYHQLRYN